jgi:hypothetical protein
MFDFLRLRTLLVLRLLQSFTRAGRCFLSVAAPPLGFRALQRLRSGEPTRPGFASPGTLRLQGSSALLAPSFSPKLHGLVSCRARSWASPFEAFPFAEREPPLGGLVPTCRSLERPAAFSTFLARLLGLARSGSPLPARGEVPTSSPLLPWASPLQGFLPDATVAGLPTTSSHGLRAGVAACLAAPQSLDHIRAGSSPWRPPPLLGFLHLVPHPDDSRSCDPGLWFRLGLR